jgi:hypothetical protein
MEGKIRAMFDIGHLDEERREVKKWNGNGLVYLLSQ